MFKMKSIAIYVVMLGTLPASAANLVMDGSFEGANAGTTEYFTGALASSPQWKVITTGSPDHGLFVLTAGVEAVADPITNGSPDSGGTNMVYFNTDKGTNTLRQTINGLSPGQYEVSFDAYQTYRGRGNTGIPSFSVTLGGASVVNFALDTLPTPSSASDASAWKHFYQVFNADSTNAPGGTAIMDFTFIAPGGTGKDIALDRVYIGVPVSSIPEPSSLALALLGLLSIGCRRGKRA